MPNSTLTSEDTASLDIEVASDSQPPRKVELDLDDAPFLKVEEPPPPAPVPEEPTQTNDNSGRNKRKKLIMIGGALAAVLIAAAAAVWWFVFRTPPPAAPVAPDPEIIVVPQAATPAGPQDIVHEFDVFMVPVNDERSQTRFLVCKFAAITQDAGVDQEMTRQQIPLRDAVYYYLRGKDATWLQDAHNYPAIKEDLLSVFNDYLSQGKLEDILFESYLSR